MSQHIRLVLPFLVVTSMVAAPRVVAQDCDNNGIADADELSLRDCNRNGVVDACDLSAQTSPDCNGNGLPDECDVFAPCAMEPSGFAGGDGTPGNPYLVCTPAQLNNVNAHLSAHFRQIADINMIAYRDFLPIGGGGGLGFNGVYDGDGFVIRNLTTTDSLAGLGLFGTCWGEAELRNIHLEKLKLTAAENFLGQGGLVGIFSGSGRITNCHVDVDSVARPASANGGLVGLLSGDATISQCSVTGVIDQGAAGGGLIGRITGNAMIDGCAAEVLVVNFGSVGGGGLIGNLETGTVERCYSVGRVISFSGPQGGLIGSVDPTAGPVIDCYWDVDTSSLTISAAGTGLNTGAMQMQASFSNWNFDTVWTIEEGNDYPRLRIPAKKGTELDCNCNGLVDVCELLDGTEFDCNGNGILDSCDLAPPCITEASGFAGGDGTNANPYRVCSPEQLNRVHEDVTASYLQTQTIDMRNVEDFEPIGPTSDRFGGKYDGGGHKVLNLEVSGRDAGLFGAFAWTGDHFDLPKIIDVHLRNVRAVGEYSAGGITGQFPFGIMVHSSSYGNIEAASFVGGLAGGATGQNRYVGRCSSGGTVTGSLYVGGLLGDFDQGIQDCYSEAEVILDKPVGQAPAAGGLMGLMTLPGDIGSSRCYATGTVTGAETGGLVGLNRSPVESYWDIETTGQLTTAGAGAETSGGRTTAEMQMQSTYEPEWDFENVWTIDEGNDYPRLRPYRRFVLGTETDDNGNGLIDSCDVGGDLDGDGAVTVADIPLFVDVLLTNGNGTLTDLNRDYRTNGDDLPLFLAALVGAP